MHVWLNLKTIKFYLIKLATDFYWQPSCLRDERASLYTFLKHNVPLTYNPRKFNKTGLRMIIKWKQKCLCRFYAVLKVGQNEIIKSATTFDQSDTFSNHIFLLDNCFVMGVELSVERSANSPSFVLLAWVCPWHKVQTLLGYIFFMLNVKISMIPIHQLLVGNRSIRHIITPRFKLALVTLTIMLNIKMSMVWIPQLLAGIRSIRHIITPRFKLALVTFTIMLNIKMSVVWIHKFPVCIIGSLHGFTPRFN